MRGHNFGRTFNIILDTLKSLGYQVKYSVLNTMTHGQIPQNRERIYLIGFLKETGLSEKFSFPKKLKLSKTIRDILEDEVAKKYYYEGKPLFKKIENFPFSEGVVYQWRRKYIRENKSGVCPTLTANMGTGGHNVPIVRDSRGIRKLTPRECARLQGFPDSFALPDIAEGYLYKQMGNSVSVPVISRIAKNMASILL